MGKKCLEYSKASRTRRRISAKEGSLSAVGALLEAYADFNAPVAGKSWLTALQARKVTTRLPGVHLWEEILRACWVVKPVF